MRSRPVSQEDFQGTVQAALSDLTTPPLEGPAVTESRSGHEYLTAYAPFFDLSAKMRAVKEIIEQIADTNTTVLIRGESGVGKDLVARAIHAASPRRHHPFVKVNCAALPAELLESELFGHEKGAFTGAYRRKLGKFEFANKGTLFLDEIGELPLALQAKLLHVLQDQEFFRVGGRELIRVDTRILASTNRNLEVALAAGAEGGDPDPGRRLSGGIPASIRTKGGATARSHSLLHRVPVAGERPGDGKPHEAPRGPRQGRQDSRGAPLP